jgi:hypothetical protein
MKVQDFIPICNAVGQHLWYLQKLEMALLKESAVELSRWCLHLFSATEMISVDNIKLRKQFQYWSPQKYIYYEISLYITFLNLHIILMTSTHYMTHNSLNWVQYLIYVTYQ